MRIQVANQAGESFVVTAPRDNTVASLEEFACDVLEGLESFHPFDNLTLSVLSETKETNEQRNRED